jgi:hypothetical protein
MSDSKTFLLTLLASILETKSLISSKGLLSLASIIDSIAFAPTPFMAPSPKIIASSPSISVVTNSIPLLEIFGGRSLMPSLFTSSIYLTILSVLSSSLYKSAAINSVGW